MVPRWVWHVKLHEICYKCFVLQDLGFWDTEDEKEQIEEIEEPIAFRAGDSINNPDIYVWHNGDEVHVAPGSTFTLEDCFSS